MTTSFLLKDSYPESDSYSEFDKKYTTIDCKYDSILNKYCEVNLISNEFIKGNYLNYNIDELFKLYTDNTTGLVIFTFGSKEILYGRKGENIKRFSPFNVDVVSTLGAGDSFKAGVTYGILKNMSDDDIVSFASATAAIAVTSFPLPLNPPSLDIVKALEKSRFI